MEKEDRQIIGNICELIPKLTPQERNNLMYLTEGMTLMSRKRDEEDFIIAVFSNNNLLQSCKLKKSKIQTEDN